MLEDRSVIVLGGVKPHTARMNKNFLTNASSLVWSVQLLISLLTYGRLCQIHKWYVYITVNCCWVLCSSAQCMAERYTCENTTISCQRPTSILLKYLGGHVNYQQLPLIWCTKAVIILFPDLLISTTKWYCIHVQRARARFESCTSGAVNVFSNNIAQKPMRQYYFSETHMPSIITYVTIRGVIISHMHFC